MKIKHQKRFSRFEKKFLLNNETLRETNDHKRERNFTLSLEAPCFIFFDV